jgi:Nup93/Nic96
MGTRDEPMERNAGSVIDPNVSKLDGGEPFESAEQLLTYYQSRTQTASLLNPRTAIICATLVKLTKIRHTIEMGNHHLAVEEFFKLGLLPQKYDLSENTKLVHAFNELEETVARIVPNMLALVMESIYKLCRLVQNEKQIDPYARKAQLDRYKDFSKAIALFTGTLKFRVSTDVMTKINKLDALIG